MAQCPPDCRPGEVPLGRRTGPPLPEAEDGDSANRDELCKILSPKLGRVLPMSAAATPRGRPQYADPRDEIASSASGDRCRSALEPGCVYLNKGPRRDANASAARAPRARGEPAMLRIAGAYRRRKARPSRAERHPDGREITSVRNGPSPGKQKPQNRTSP